jgi:glycosyltransferase involved in cell wall biosynthesis
MNNPKISIIVPIYKAESTLLRCLDSLKAQTFTDFEVLMVDDGSPDRCSEMMDEYAQKDQRFKPLYKVNGGVSSARQFGIDHASGEYTIHADPDDWVEPTMLEDLYRKAKEEDADMVICDFFENTYKGQKYIKQQPSALDHNTVLRDLFHHLLGSCWNKLIRRDCYSKYDVCFPSGISFCEDKYVIASVLKNNVKVAYLPCAFYHYVRNDKDSLSMRYTDKTYEENLVLRELFDSLLGDTPIHEEVHLQQSYSILAKAFYGGQSYYSSARFKKIFGGYKPYIEQKKDSSLFEKLLFRLSIDGFYQLAIRFFNLLTKLKHILYQFK